MKHTLGPWRPNGTFSKVENDKEDIVICEMSVNRNSSNFSYDEYKANANLIAAAPEMLDVLVDVLDNLKKGGAVKRYKIQEIVDKATGKQ